MGCFCLPSRYYPPSTPLLFAEEPALPRPAPFLPRLTAARIGSTGPRPRSSPSARSSRTNPATSAQPHTAPRDRRHRHRRQRGPRSNDPTKDSARTFRSRAASAGAPRPASSSPSGRPSRAAPSPRSTTLTHTLPSHPRDPPHTHLGAELSPSRGSPLRSKPGPAASAACPRGLLGVPAPRAPPPHPSAQPPLLKAQGVAPTRHGAEPRRRGPRLLGTGPERAGREDRLRQRAHRARPRSLTAAGHGGRPLASGGADVRSESPRGPRPTRPSLPVSKARLPAFTAHLREGNSGGSPLLPRRPAPNGPGVQRQGLTVHAARH